MRHHWSSLNESDRAVFRATIAFLNGRLEERATVDWALRLRPHETQKRMALLDLIDNSDGQKIREPWRSAWRLIEESWNHPTFASDASIHVYDAQRRLRAGDRSGALINAIVELFSPRLKVEPFSSLHPRFREPSKRPKKVKDLFSMGLTSSNNLDPSLLNLGDLTDRPFLLSLALALDAAVVAGLDIARRIGWDGETRMRQLGGLYRVYYVPTTERTDGEQEPDEFHHGIAPSVKLLHSVLSQLVKVDISTAVAFIHRWMLTNSPIHLRLWAALSRDSQVTPANEVGNLLLSLDDIRFWRLDDYPEIAELRAKRFPEFNTHTQVALTARIRKGPPRNHWLRETDADHIKNARLYCAIRELRRIEIAGATLPKRDKAWLDARIDKFPELIQMARLDEGFLSTPKAHWILPNPDNRYDQLAGEERLKALETALSSARRGWDDDPAGRAADWIRQQGHSIHIIDDLESIPDAGATFVRVWEQFGWAHSPTEGEEIEDAKPRELTTESARILSLLAKLTEASMRQAIDGIAHWLSTWKKEVVALPVGIDVWLKLWPIAVEATNANQPVEEEADLNTVVQSSDGNEPMDLDTLNTPAGKLVDVFLASCPRVLENDHPFDVNGALRAMRDVIIIATGRSGLIAKYRMIEALGYFLRADPEWTREHLITPLRADNMEAIALWRAIARRTHYLKVLEIIGDTMAERATDRRLGRETQRSLVFSLVVECLHAFREQRDPAVPHVRIQQMLRSLDDEVRAYGAETVQRFVRDLSTPDKEGQTPPPPEQLFRAAAVPFFGVVWPQERSLTTPGISRALANLPATAHEAFAEAVETIERFLVPFECWSMIEYGLYGEENDHPKLSIIDNRAKADAFLRLLDMTTGTTEGSVIPYDLADALNQIRRVAPKLAEHRVFHRLATAARRG